MLAVLVIGGEYGTGMIRTTLAAMPRRITRPGRQGGRVGGLTLAAGTVAVLALAAGRAADPARHGFATAPSLADGPTLRAAVGSVLYLVLVALLSLGVATAVRTRRPRRGRCSACSTSSRSSRAVIATRTGNGTCADRRR